MLLHDPSEPRFTYGDYVRWSGDERWELIDGEVFAMSPAPSRGHQEAVVGLVAQIAPQLQGGPCRPYVAPFDIRLPQGAEADAAVETVVQPDIAVICDPSKLDAAGCRGAPDWIVEVVSPATAARDRIVKRDLYERHGVREYWVLDPDDRRLTIHRLDPSTGRFSAPATADADGTTSPRSVPGVAIDWSLVFSS